MRRSLLQYLSIALSFAVIAAAVWFWAAQVGDVLDLLSLQQD
jgi:hypothetical protein